MQIRILPENARPMFQEADRLYQEGHYLEALQHLAELNDAFPDTFNVLFPMLLCREKLGRVNDARQDCFALLSRFPEPKHQQRLKEVMSRLDRGEHAPREMLAASNIVERTVEHVPIDPGGSIWFHGYWIPVREIALAVGVLVLLIAGLALLPVLLPMGGEGETAAAGASPETPAPPRLAGMVVLILTQYLLGCATWFATLWTMNKLLHEDAVMNLIDACVMMVLFTLCLFIPIIGWIVAYYKVSEHYDLSVFEIGLFILIQMVFNMAFLYVLVPPLLGRHAVEVIQLLGG